MSRKKSICNEDIKASFFESIRLEETSRVKELIVHNFNSTARDRELVQHGFCQAVQQGSIDLVQVFLDHGGVTVDEPGPVFGESPLMQAIRYGYVDLVNFLIQCGADINFKCTKEQSTSLHAAVSGRSESEIQFSILKILIQLPGIKLNEYNTSGKTPLMVAVQHSRWKALEILLQAGADVNKLYFKDNEPQGMPLAFLCFGYFNPHVDMHNSTRCLEVLLNATRDPDVQWQGHTLLMSAIQANYILAVKYLISINCDLNLSSGESKFDFCEGVSPTPVVEAYARCNSRIVQLLIGAGCCFHSLEHFLNPSYLGPVQNNDQSLKNWLQEKLSCPRSLKDICRIRIRSCLGKFPSERIGDLPIPNVLKDYIMLYNTSIVCLAESADMAIWTVII